MVKTKQSKIRRSVAQAYRNMDKVINDLAPIAIVFAEDHDDYAELLRIICVSMEMGQRMLCGFCLKAWGRIPDNWDAWRNPATEQRENTDGSTK